MAYGRRKKSSKVRGKSLIKKITEVSTPPVPIINETPSQPTQPTQSSEATGYGAESGPPTEFQIAMSTKEDEVEEIVVIKKKGSKK